MYSKFPIITLLISFSLAEAAQAKDYGMNGNRRDTNIEANKDPHKKDIHPLPRHIFLPYITYSRVPDERGEFELDFADHHYWLIVMISSWNERSADIVKIFNTHMSEFNTRDIGVIGLFSQDTLKSIETWRQKNKPLFNNYFASRNFLDSLKNPPIPQIWLLGKKGEILLKYDLPTVQQIDTLIEKSLILTNF